MKTGKITPYGVVLETHEYKTITLFTELGIDIELIPKSEIPGVHTADIRMQGLEWEIKSPKGNGRWLIENTLRRAVKQSCNIILDLRRIKIPMQKCLVEINKQFQISKGIKNLKVITKNNTIIDYNK